MEDPVSPPSVPAPRTDVSPDASESTISITVQYAGGSHTFTLPSTSILDDLLVECESILGSEYDLASCKLIAPPPTGLLKAADEPDFPLASLDGRRLRLMISRISDVASLNAAALAARAPSYAKQQSLRRHAARTFKDVTYTFMQLRPLKYLPNPQRSLDFLTRLKNDRGIRIAMRTHEFTVGLLTEMDPAAYTEVSHEGTTRVLGLNRNQGEVIELRLRTDVGDGYRDYRTIRKTLCHELAHNVHGPHDRKFWDLCHRIERRVDQADWEFGGRTAGGVAPVYDPTERDEDVFDHGGWTGGEFVLGGAEESAGSAGGRGLSRREILARAAEERTRRMNEERGKWNGKGPKK